MNNFWSTCPVPAMRVEALYGDRLVRCFIDRPSSVHQLFQDTLQRSPAAEALVCGEQRWTYAETASQVGRIAAALQQQGVAAGDRVALLLSNRAEFVFTLFALQHLGAVAVPIGTREQRPGVAYMLRQCGAIGLVFDHDLADRVPLADETPALRLCVAVGGPAAGTAQSLDTLLAAAAGLPVPPVAVVDEGDVAVILYTSGTTGNPKGAMLTHRNIAHSAMHYQACMGVRASDRSALAVPASHVTGLIATVVSMVLVGGTTVIVPAFKAADFMALVARERITHTLMVPAMYNLCLLTPAFASHDLSAWRVAGYGGAPMPVATIDRLLERVPALVLINAYGSTETTSPVTMMPAGLTRAHGDSVGVALPAADIRVMDEQGRELPAGESGELWIGGPMVVPGYWGNPAATASNFTAGYWHSGDLGSVDAQGFVRLFDRKKDMLNRGGFKIYSVEVENTVMALPGMVEVAVVGKPCPVLGERVHAFIHAPGVPQNDAVVRAHCAANLADYKVPESFTWSDSPLPRNANGKLVKRAMRDSLLAQLAAG